jgi:thiamine kinase-like enzyme
VDYEDNLKEIVTLRQQLAEEFDENQKLRDMVDDLDKQLGLALADYHDAQQRIERLEAEITKLTDFSRPCHDVEEFYKEGKDG